LWLKAACMPRKVKETKDLSPALPVSKELLDQRGDFAQRPLGQLAQRVALVPDTAVDREILDHAGIAGRDALRDQAGARTTQRPPLAASPAAHA